MSVEEAKELIGLQRAHLGFLQEQFRLAKHKLFASKDEAYPGQGELFNEAEDIAQQSEAELAEEEPFTEYTAKRKKRNRKVVDDTVEREVVIHDIDEADKTCDCCQGQMHVMGKDVTKLIIANPDDEGAFRIQRCQPRCRVAGRTARGFDRGGHLGVKRFGLIRVNQRHRALDHIELLEGRIVGLCQHIHD